MFWGFVFHSYIYIKKINIDYKDICNDTWCDVTYCGKAIRALYVTIYDIIFLDRAPLYDTWWDVIYLDRALRASYDTRHAVIYFVGLWGCAVV